MTDMVKIDPRTAIDLMLRASSALVYQELVKLKDEHLAMNLQADMLIAALLREQHHVFEYLSHLVFQHWTHVPPEHQVELWDICLVRASTIGNDIEVNSILTKFSTFVPNQNKETGWQVPKHVLAWEKSLELAAQNGHAAVIESLLEVPAKLNMGWYGAIEKAAGAGHCSIVVSLLAQREQVDPDIFSLAWTASLRAATDVNVIKALLHPAYSLSIQDEATPAWCAAFYSAASRGQSAIVEQLMTVFDRVPSSRQLSTWKASIHTAAERGHIEIVRLLLLQSDGMDSLKRSPALSTTMYAAARGGHVAIVRLVAGWMSDTDGVIFASAWDATVDALRLHSVYT